MRSRADRYCPACDKTWPSWWLSECPDCQGELVRAAAMDEAPAEEEPKPQAPPDPWGNWALGLGLACIIIGPISALAPAAALGTSGVAIYHSTKGRSALWKGITGAVLGLLFALVYLEIWIF